ncbi:hypothetical protein DMENIID0001_109170 [Sergentomyia squamirostris]
MAGSGGLLVRQLLALRCEPVDSSVVLLCENNLRLLQLSAITFTPRVSWFCSQYAKKCFLRDPRTELNVNASSSS